MNLKNILRKLALSCALLATAYTLSLNAEETDAEKLFSEFDKQEQTADCNSCCPQPKQQCDKQKECPTPADCNKDKKCKTQQDCDKQKDCKAKQDCDKQKDCKAKQDCGPCDPKVVAAAIERFTALKETNPEAFNKIDCDNNGVIDEKEACCTEKTRLCREKAEAKALKCFDADGDGKLSEEEQAAAQKACDKKKAQHQAWIKKHDTNGDGKIDKAEKEAACKDNNKRNKKAAQKKCCPKKDVEKCKAN